MEKIHIEISDLIQKIFDQQKIRVDEIDIDWIDVSTFEGANYKVQKVKLTSVVTRNKKKRWWDGYEAGKNIDARGEKNGF